jgi:multiple sugar transport system substrate-binding protein
MRRANKRKDSMETKKTKFAALTSVFAITALVVTACGSSATNSPSAATTPSAVTNSPIATATPTPINGAGKTLTVLISADGKYGAQQQQWFKDVSAAFQTQTGATVNFQTFASGSEELTKIQTSVVANQGPDIYVVGTTFTPTAYSTGAFVSLTPDNWNQVGGKDKFVQADLGISGPTDSDQVGIPYTSGPFVMAYNTDLLAKAGIDKPATTWDGLAAQAKQLTGNGVYGMAVGYKDGFDPWKFIWAMSRQAGNPIIAGKVAKVDDPTTLKAYQTYFGWLTKDHVVDPASVGWNDGQALAAFASGKAAFFPMSTTSNIPTLKTSAVKDTYKFALMPVVPPGATSLPAGGVGATSILAGNNVVVAKYSKNQDLAFALVKYLTDDANQQVLFNTFGTMPVNQTTFKTVTTSNPALGPILDSAASSVATPFSGAWADTQLALMNVVVQTIPDLSAGSVSDSKLQSLLTAAQKTAQASLDKAP